MNDETKKTSGRPFKMENWLSELKIVLATEDILFLTDDDLRILVNERLPESDRITDRTLENWKYGRFHPDEQLGKDFLKCIRLALIKQKQWLGKQLINADNATVARTMCWILERKHSEEFALKTINHNINKNEQQTTIQITAANESQRLLIDNIINAEFEEIQPIKIGTSNDNTEDDDYEF